MTQNKSEIYGGELIFSQEADSCQDGDQQLIIGCSDAGGGKFLYFKTERWAFDNIEEITEIIKRAKKAFEVNNDAK